MNPGTWLSTATLVLLLSFAVGQECATQIERPHFSCEIGCTPVASSVNLVKRCELLRPFGCEVKECMGENGSGFSCVSASDRSIPTCANFNITLKDTSGPTAFTFLADLNTPPQKADYYFLIDISSSMIRNLANVRNKVFAFMDGFKGDSLARFGVGVFRREMMESNGFMEVQALTTSHKSVRRALWRLSSSPMMAGDYEGPEANLQALTIAARRPWAIGARRTVFLFGDAPGHEPSVIGTSARVNRESVARVMKRRKVIVIGINYRRIGLDGPTRSFGLDPEVLHEGGQTSFIAKQTGGIVTPSSTSLFDASWTAKKSVGRVYSVDESNCQDFLQFVPGKNPFPLHVDAQASAATTFSLSLKNGFCRTFTCQYTFSENGVELEPFTVALAATSENCGSDM